MLRVLAHAGSDMTITGWWTTRRLAIEAQQEHSISEKPSFMGSLYFIH